MTTPPPGREQYVLSTATVEKPPLLFHHLLDLADGMEAHGLAAHASAPLAIAELVARLCLGAPLSVSDGKADSGGGNPGEKVPGAGKETGAGGGKGTAAAAAASKVGKGGADVGKKEVGIGAPGESFPALTLACLRRSRLLLKLGPT